MRVRTLALAALTTVLAVGASSEAGENWPAWRGPSLNGVSGEKNLPVRWSTEENIVWKIEMPAWSGSTPIIWSEKIFLSVAAGEEIQLWSVDRNTGVPIWKRHLSDGNHRQHKQNMSSPSPVTEGQNVYVMTGTGILTAFNFDGDQLWRRDIQADHGRFGLNWGYASSPLLFEDGLFVQVLHGMRTDDPSYVLRIDKNTGQTVWCVERPTDAIRESPDSVHNADIAAVQRQHRDRHHWRRRGDWPRSGHRQGALAGRWSQPAQQPELPHHRIAGRG